LFGFSAFRFALFVPAAKIEGDRHAGGAQFVRKGAVHHGASHDHASDGQRSYGPRGGAATPPILSQAPLQDTHHCSEHSLEGASRTMKGGMPPGAGPAEISREAGGAFSLFGGYITGRQIELVPNLRIVQAWRAGGWDPGHYSIAKFELVEQGSGTKIVFDHTGFPIGQAEHLAEGWKGNYWEPLEKFLT
jgi:hypothetical protein